jgi:hypothetical protein
MSKATSYSRKQRRAQMRSAGMLKVKNMYSPLSGQRQAWYKKTREDGQQAHEAHLKRVNDQIEEQLQTKLNNLKETWKSSGYNDQEIKMLEDAFMLTSIKYKDTLRSDRKEARRLMKEARESFQNRITK